MGPWASVSDFKMWRGSDCCPLTHSPQGPPLSQEPTHQGTFQNSGRLLLRLWARSGSRGQTSLPGPPIRLCLAPPRPAPTLRWPAGRLRQSCAPWAEPGRVAGGAERKCGCAGFRGRWCDVSRAWRSRKRQRSRPEFPAPAPAPFPLPPCSTSSPFFPKAGLFSGAFRA